MIKGKDIIVVGLNPWDSEIASNCRNIVMEFSKFNRVLYINHPMDRISFYENSKNNRYQVHIDIIKNKRENLIQVEENIWTLYPIKILESVNWIPSTPIFRIINRINNKRFSSDIKAAIARLNFKDFILFNDNDIFRSYHLKELLKPVQSIYYSRDYLLGVPYWQKHGKTLEPELIAKSDVVVANSTYLANLASKYNKNTYYVGQGCNIADFDADKVAKLPVDMAQINSPVIGYIGSLLALRLDLNLLEAVAKRKKEWNFVFIGMEDSKFKKSILHELSNVYFLGSKNLEEIPSYLAQFDVAINPQKLNDITIGNHPRKIDEYLAMGKPVVATETPTMEIFKGYVYFATTADNYIEQIERAMIENTTRKQRERIEYARSYTWERSVSEIYKAMLQIKPDISEMDQ